MKKLVTSNISLTERAPISDATLDHITESYSEIVDSLVKGLITDTTGIIILYGCVPTVGGGNYAMTAGAVYYLGEIYLVDAFVTAVAPGVQIPVWVLATTYRTGDPVEFENGSGGSAGNKNFHSIRKLKWQFGASGSGLFNYNSASVKRLTAVDLKADKTLATTTTANSLIAPNIYFTENADVSWPGGGFHVVLVIANGSYVSQWAYSISDARFYYRNSQNSGSTWSTWKSPVNTSGDTITGTLQVNGGIRTQTSGVYLKTIVVDIGDWNMDSNSGVVVALSIDFKKIRSITGMIRSDDDSTYYPLNSYSGANTPDVGIGYIDTLGINLFRAAASTFDSTSFDSTSFNRGWLTITYEA